MARRTLITNAIIANLIACLRTWATLKSLLVGIFAIVICIICTSGVLVQEADAYRVEEILDGIPFPDYKELQANLVKCAQSASLVHQGPSLHEEVLHSPEVFSVNYEEMEKKDQHPPLHKEVFHYLKVFEVNYEEMEKRLKVYMYEDEETKTCELPYGSNDVRFLQTLFRCSGFLTDNPNEADLFFIPLPCRATPKELNLKKYVYGYPHWNRTLGADHFYTTPPGIRVLSTEHAPFLEKNSIHVRFSTSYNDSQYVPNKDVVIPQSLPRAPGDRAHLEERTIPVYWVGQSLETLTSEEKSEWINDTDFKQYSQVGDHWWEELNISRSKYCICHGRGDIQSKWIGLAIRYGCVPVILSDDYVLPFKGILNWKKFSVRISEANARPVNKILEGIESSKYQKLQANVVKVQKHFQWNLPPMKYDALHLALYELWLRTQETLANGIV